MSNSDKDPHGIAPDRSAAALLLIDVINDFDFPEADQLLRFARPMAECIAALKARAKKAGMPVLYVNDNFGRWRSDFKGQVEHCLKPEANGRDIVELLNLRMTTTSCLSRSIPVSIQVRLRCCSDFWGRAR
jgi:nicotinamidase-related amidase